MFTAAFMFTASSLFRYGCLMGAAIGTALSMLLFPHGHWFWAPVPALVSAIAPTFLVWPLVATTNLVLAWFVSESFARALDL
jgi:hypothetical protein